MNLSIRNYPSFRNRHNHRHHQFHACSGCHRHSDTHCHIGKDKLLVLQEHLAEEQSVLEWQLTISMMALGAGRASVIVGCSWPSESLWYPFSGDPTEVPAEQYWPVPTLWLGYGLSGHVVSKLQE